MRVINTNTNTDTELNKLPTIESQTLRSITYPLNKSGCAKKSAYISSNERRSSINVGRVTWKQIDKKHLEEHNIISAMQFHLFPIQWDVTCKYFPYFQTLLLQVEPWRSMLCIGKLAWKIRKITREHYIPLQSHDCPLTP